MGYAEVTMTATMSAVEESRIRNLVKFVTTVHIVIVATLHDWRKTNATM